MILFYGTTRVFSFVSVHDVHMRFRWIEPVAFALVVCRIDTVHCFLNTFKTFCEPKYLSRPGRKFFGFYCTLESSFDPYLDRPWQFTKPYVPFLPIMSFRRNGTSDETAVWITSSGYFSGQTSCTIAVILAFRCGFNIDFADLRATQAMAYPIV